jgi:hypothetical protein
MRCHVGSYACGATRCRGVPVRDQIILSAVMAAPTSRSHIHGFASPTERSVNAQATYAIVALISTAPDDANGRRRVRR